MTRKLTVPLGLLGAIAGLFCLPRLALALTAPEISQLAKSVTVLIEGEGTGSGVLIQRDGSTYTVLTAKHVIDLPDNYKIIMPTGNRYSLTAQSIIKLPELDLALLEFTSNEDYPYISIGDSDSLVEGIPLFVAGFPGKGSTINPEAFNFTEGQLTAYSARPMNGGYALVYTNKTLQGMSGGPVFNAEGQLVGIHGAGDGESQQLEKLNKTVFVKTGFNLGIPINTFLRAGGPALDKVKFISMGNSSTPERSTTATPPLGGDIQLQGSDRTTPNLASKPPVPVARVRPEQASSTWFLEALWHYQQGETSQALSLSTQAINARPGFAPAYALRGSVRYLLQDYTGALVDFNDALERDRSRAATYVGRGLTHSAMRNPEGAIADYTQAIQIDPDPLSYYNRGVVLLNQGRDSEAIADLRQSADLALATNNQEDYQRALEAIRIATRECNQSIRKICDR